MSYQVIARKYRPQTFEQVVGQKPIVTTLQNAVVGRRLHHAYLFSGPRGVGKTTVARLFAKAMNCSEGPTATPCNRCASCEEIAQSRSLDVLEIDGASNRGIENIRELRETVRYAPARDRFKVFIIDEVHMLTDPAWNALLKTLEEPPPQVVFVFATTEYREIPRTILSRCQHFEFRRVARAEILAHLAQVAEGERVTLEPAALDLIARAGEGSLRDALSALDQVIAFSGDAVSDEQARTILGVVDRDLILGFFAAVRGGDCTRLVQIVDVVFEKGYAPVDFLEDLLAQARDLLLARTVAEPRRYLAGGEEEVASLVERAAAWSEDELLRLVELLTREEGRIKNSSHPRFLLEALAIRMARLADLRPIEEILARLEAGGPVAAPAAPPRGPGASPERGGGEAAAKRSTAEAPPRPASRVEGAALEPGRGLAPPSTGGDLPGDAAAPRIGAAGGSGATGPLAGAGGGGDAQAQVEALLKRVHDERGAIGGILAQAAWVQIEAGAVQIVFDEKQALFRDRVLSRDVADYLRRVAREITGRDLALQVGTGSPGAFESIPMSAASGSPAAGRGVSRPGATSSAAGALPEAVSDLWAAPTLGAGAPQAARTAPPTATEADLRSAPESAGPAAASQGAPGGAAPVRPAVRGGAGPDDAERRALRERAAGEPAIRTLMQQFGAEIVDVEPL